jgi:hypothetical protein
MTARRPPAAGRPPPGFTTAASGARLASVSDTFRRTRGPASKKFRRAPATGKAHAEREQFGKQWGAFNAQEAKKLRKKGP